MSWIISIIILSNFKNEIIVSIILDVDILFFIFKIEVFVLLILDVGLFIFLIEFYFKNHKPKKISKKFFFVLSKKFQKTFLASKIK